jgi:riboflavin kinase/FMN adenylyltransferase
VQIHFDIAALPTFRNAVITIGSFDGVHNGHQIIVRRVLELARSRQGEAVLITFEPHPRLVINPNDTKLRLLTTVSEKAERLAQLGIDHMVVTPFTDAFRKLSPDEYIKDFLVAHFHPSCIVIGYDHRFGNDRSGDISYLMDHAAENQFEVAEISRQMVDDIAVSSTKVRKALEIGDVDTANALLGYAYRLSGKVIHGDQIGIKLGFPTANVQLPSPHKLVPADGVYAVRVKLGAEQFGGMLYIGPRPTINNELEQRIEVNIFDFNRDIYGAEICLELLAFIRPDARFPDLEALKQQLAADQHSVLAILRELDFASA